MTEKPIIFSGPMVRAILAGLKTQTRRPLRVQPIDILSMNFPEGEWVILEQREPEPRGKRIRCWYGKPGDRLWVRETFVLESSFGLERYTPPFKGEHPIRWVDDPDYGLWWEQPHYRATDPTPELAYPDLDEPHCRWRPSIHMPRWASRIMLEITDIRVERVQDISEGDAEAEGVDAISLSDVPRQATLSRRQDFSQLWNFIYAKKGQGWDMNPWVWAISFKRL